MKCDVCDAKIPLGSNQCPNCGYKMPIKKVSTFNVDSVSHEHIKIQNDKTLMSKVNVKAPRNDKQLSSDQELLKLAKIIVGIIILLAVITFAVTKLINQDDNRFENLSFQEIIDNGDDMDGTAQIALDYKNKIVKELDSMNLIPSYIDEYCTDENGLYANISIQIIDKGIDYTIVKSFGKGILVSDMLSIFGDSKDSLLEGFQGDKTIIAKLGKLINNEDIVDIIDESRMYIKEEKEAENILDYRSDKPSLYISQSLDDSTEMYHFTILYDCYYRENHIPLLE